MPRIRVAIRSGWKRSSCVDPLAGRRVEDRLARHRPHRQRRAAAGVAVELGQQRRRRSRRARRTPRRRSRRPGRSSRRGRAGRRAAWSRLRIATSSSISSSSTWSRPAVSTISTSSPVRLRLPERPLGDLGRVAARSPARRPSRRRARPSSRAARPPPAAGCRRPRGRPSCPRLASSLASFAQAVVLPEPWRPGHQDHRRCPSRRRRGRGSRRPSAAASSSLTIFTTCWPGLRLSSTPAPRQRSLTCVGELLDDLEVDVGLEQREPDLAHRAVDVGLGQLAARADAGERVLQAIGELVEHRAVQLTRRAAYSRTSEQRRRRTRGRRTAAGPRGPRRRRSASPGGRARAAIASAIPPFAVPSSLVRTTPVRSTASANACAWRRPFWPVVASITISVSCGAPSRRFSATRRDLRQLLHQVRVGVEPPGRVGDDDVGAARLGRRDRVEDHRARVAARRCRARSRRRRARPRPRAARSRPRDRCRPRRRSPTGRARRSRCQASLPIVVVLPVPLTPTTMITVGRAPMSMRAASLAARPRRAARSAARGSPRAPVTVARLDLGLEPPDDLGGGLARRRRRGSAPPRGAPTSRRRSCRTGSRESSARSAWRLFESRSRRRANRPPPARAPRLRGSAAVGGGPAASPRSAPPTPVAAAGRRLRGVRRLRLASPSVCPRRRRGAREIDLRDAALAHETP